MPRRPKPWFRTSRKSWYVTIDGVQHSLGPDKSQAYERFYELMRQPRRRKVASGLLVAIADRFLEWVSQHRSPATFQFYRDRLQPFVALHPDLRLAEIKPFHVQQWVDLHPEHSAATKRNNIRVVKRCLNWAAEQGYVDANPIAHMPAPSGGRRETVVAPDEFEQLLSFVHDESFRRLLMVTYETGCRPQESLRVEARHVDLERSRWVFPTAESKTKRAPRIVYLSETAAEITAQLAATHPSGPLFRNSTGRAWTKYSVACAFGRLQVQLGKAEMKRLGKTVDERRVAAFAETLQTHRTVKGVVRQKTRADLLCEARRKLTQRTARDLAPRLSLYVLRHSWATNALLRGVDSLTVAILMGHRDPSTLARVYQHLSHRPDHLLAEARRACR